jgi:DNA-binding response OmpR family regulator
VTKVLLVEDNPSVRSLITRFLTRDGVLVVTEDQSQTALEFGRRYGLALDLLIVDVQIAGQDGITFALEFRMLCPNVWVLLMTGFGSPRLEVLKLAGMRILVKPFSQRRLLDTVKDLLLLDQRTDGGTTLA